MNKSKKWQTLSECKMQNEKLKIDTVVELLLHNRGIISKKDREAFLHPQLESVTIEAVGIDSKHLIKAIQRIQKAFAEKEQVIIFGDYDVDGITGTAILWESLSSLGLKVMPYIPHRIGEGYGLSVKGIDNVLQEYPDTKLIITVDNGIVAHEAASYAHEKNIDVIITDHHTKGESLPDAVSIVHTTKLCGAGVAWLFSRELNKHYSSSQSEKFSLRSNNNIPTDHLSLVALATVADLVPLTGANRTLLIHGLQQLRTTKRPGIVALCDVAQLPQNAIDVYAIGHILGPRLNAMGRMESAMDSLRLLCTKDRLKAKVLADTLDRTNKQRQILTQSLALHAITQFKSQNAKVKSLLFIAHKSYEEGVIGLVAGKLVEEYYRPAIVLSLGEKISKASARSVAGFNIIEFIRGSSHLLVNAGGHPMAAGFSVETANIPLLQESMETMAEGLLDGELLTRVVKIDCELPMQYVSQELYDSLQRLAPFGMGNPEASFVAKDVVVQDIRTVGKEKNHLKLELRSKNQEVRFSAIAFGMGDMASTIHVGGSIDIVYTIDENVWNDKKSLQLKIRDIHTKKQ